MGEKSGEIQDKEILGVIEKFAEIQRELNLILIDRNEPIRLAVICMIARENMILLGPPGTSKSMLTSEMC
jgi:MoxR-like ATPase